MSHACVLVAVDVVNPQDREEVEAAVTFQMQPYDENGEWFRDSSRWDWWQIGGRYAGMLNADYDPETDPRNWGTCRLCAGTGTRPGGLEQFGRAWFDGCHGCNGCKGTGRERLFHNAPVDFDVVQVKSLDKAKIVPAYAFLRNRHWHEAERLGWFGGTAKTECEIKAQQGGDDSDVLTRRCTTIGDENARIITWNEPYEIWKLEYVKRFIDPLPDTAVLVVVDYHV